MSDPVQPAVSYQGVTFSYPARPGDDATPPAVENITLSVAPGERLGILGPNGGGKSTLIKLTLGMLAPAKGQILVMGRSPVAARRDRLIGYVPQRSQAELAFPISGRQAVEMAANLGTSPLSSLSTPARERVSHALSLVGVTSFAGKPVGHLSGGQWQRIQIARALSCEPRVLLLDEPTVGVDPAGQQQFAQLLTTLAAQTGVAIIVVSHDLRTVAAGCDRVACLSRTLHYHAGPAGLTPSVLAEVFRHDVAAIFGDVHIDAHKASECSHNHGVTLPTLSATPRSNKP